MADLSSSPSMSSSIVGPSSLAEVTAIVKALNFNLSIKLDETNYVYWKMQVKAAIRGVGLECLINESDFTPSSDSDDTELFKEVWKRADNYLVC
ncbi:hypothetical protein Syun_018392 [Stephania yunnanensis]|uniref:Retrotransposon Copia-like N-terminal domain-containing protein n=1 Tax=Stephania yunnanensis TaxID=152371 RepID=A0AAP0NWZ9_9MAGN